MFQSARLFLLNTELNEESLQEALESMLFEPCASMTMISRGWVPVTGQDDGPFTLPSMGNILVRLRTEERILPSAAVKLEVEKKVKEIEAREMRPVKRKEKQQIKDEVIQTLMPKTLTKQGDTFGWVDTKNKFLFVAESSAKKAEDFLGVLRESLGELAVRLPGVETSPGMVMSQWLQDNPTNNFSVGYAVTLQVPDEKSATVTVKNLDLFSEQVRSHLDEGMRVKKLQVEWNEMLAFHIEDDLSIKSIKRTDAMAEDLGDTGDDVISMMDADFAQMSSAISNVFLDLFKACGGLQE